MGINYIFQKKKTTLIFFQNNFFKKKEKEKEKKETPTPFTVASRPLIWVVSQPHMALGVVAPPLDHLGVAFFGENFLFVYNLSFFFYFKMIIIIIM
jgi:hypothetical protein